MKRWYRRLRSRVFPDYIRADLHSTLQAADPDATLEERVEWLGSLMEWTRLPASTEAGAQKSSGIEATRVRFLMQMLERYPDLKTKVSQTLQSILIETRSEELFFATGIELHQGFSKELVDRSVAKMIPRFREPDSLKQIFEMLFTSDEDVEWLRGLSAKDLEQLAHLALADDVAFATFRAKQVDAIAVALNWLAARMVGIVVEGDVRTRLPLKDVHRSPFFKLQNEVSAELRNPDRTDLYGRYQPWLIACRHELEGVYPLLENAGVSVDLVYKLESLRSILRRISLLAVLHDNVHAGRASPPEVVKFLAELADLHMQRASLVSFLGTSFNMIARKIVERSSETGEHYIVRTRGEYREMFRSAAGGGMLTVFTTVLKTVITKTGLPLFFEGLFAGLNYAISFSAIQLCHFTLATKTPAMIATTLSGKLRDISSPQHASEFVDEVVAMHRSAFISVVGNLGLVIPGAILFDFLCLAISGHHFFKAEYGLYQLEAHSPFTSLTIWYAIVTGFILWFSSILGGWFENWMVYRRQFEVFETSTGIRRYFGIATQKRLASFLRRHVAGLATNVFLGFMLAYCLVFGKFFGLPLDVRHVTLSTGTLTFSVLSLPNPGAEWIALVSALIGVGFIATLNFGVSFTLSLFVAARARNIRLRTFPQLLRLILMRFRRRPLDFYYMSKGTVELIAAPGSPTPIEEPADTTAPQAAAAEKVISQLHDGDDDGVVADKTFQGFGPKKT